MKHSLLVLVFSHSKHSSNHYDRELETLTNASTKKYTTLNRVTKQSLDHLPNKKSNKSF